MRFSALNKSQKAAISLEGNVLLKACPGSGKTRVIVHKIAYELEKQHTNRKIGAVTFTNRAADEIISRLDAMGIDSNRLWTGTIHSFCLEWIVKPYHCFVEELKYGFSLADPEFCKDLEKELKDKYGIGVFEEINYRLTPSGDFETVDSQQRQLLNEYHEILESKKLIDFEQLLYYAYIIVSSNEKIAKTLGNIFFQLCVDEFQDTRELQYLILGEITKLSKLKTHIIFVGDVDQSVYTSLGGVAKSKEEIENYIGAPINELTLSGNYRSTQKIIDYYSNYQTIPIKIEALGEIQNAESTISLNKSLSKEAIVPVICNIIKQSMENGVPAHEICVLVPQWWLITSITKKIKHELPDVPFDASSMSPMSRLRENIWFKISRLFLTDPSLELQNKRQRWANEILNKLGELTNTNIIDSENSTRHFLKLVNSIKPNESIATKFLRKCFMSLTQKLSLPMDDNSVLKEEFDFFFKKTQERLEDETYSFPDEISEFRKMFKYQTGVVINTCVGIKGEEFDTVIAYGLLKGYLPHWNEIINNNREVESSLNSLYVICSRAKRNLYLFAECDRKTKSGNSYEINRQLYDVSLQYDILES